MYIGNLNDYSMHEAISQSVDLILSDCDISSKELSVEILFENTLKIVFNKHDIIIGSSDGNP